MYCKRVIDEFENPFRMEKLGNYSHLVENTNSGCGDESHIYILYNNDTIENIGFQSFGCASCLAVTSFLCKTIFGKNLSDIRLIKRSLFECAFSELEPSQRHCIDMGEVLMNKIVSVLQTSTPHKYDSGFANDKKFVEEV